MKALFLSGLALLLLVAVVLSSKPLLAQGSCTVIRFAPGESAAEISGIAPPNDVVCYTVETGSGQTASVDVIEGRNVIFSIRDLIDAQVSYRFRTEQTAYTILVGQLMRSVTSEPFRIRVAVSGAY